MQFEHQTPFELAAFLFSHKAGRCKGCHLLLDHQLLDHLLLDHLLLDHLLLGHLLLGPLLVKRVMELTRIHCTVKASIFKGLEAFDLFICAGCAGYFWLLFYICFSKK